MDLMGLTDVDFQAISLVEGWTSLIWTERFQDPGEFQLKTPLIEETINLIPEDSFVAIRDSYEVMVVENHSIAINEDGVEELTTTGRSIVPWLLENRYLLGDFQQPWDTYKQYTYQDAVACLIWNALVNSTTVDVTGSPRPHPIEEAISNVMVHDRIWDQTGITSGAAGSPFELHDWSMGQGEVWKTVLDWLKLGKLGISAARPIGNILEYSMTTSFDTSATAAKGQPYHSNTYHLGKLNIEIFNGAKRTQVPAVANPLDPVIFRYDAGHIDSPTYLRSAKGFRNICQVICSDGELLVGGTPTDPNGVGNYLGLSRRAMLLDLGQIDSSIVDLNKYMTQQGTIALNNANIQLLADGAISPVAPYQYRSDYYLGDTVTVVGEYGVVEDMQVIEFVRSQDKTGEKGYPTVVHIL